MRDTDKKKLAAACGRFLYESDSTSKFVWHQKLDSEHQLIESLNVKELGILPVPVSDQDVERLKHLCKTAQFALEAKSIDTIQTLEMDGSHIHYDNSLAPYLSSLVTKNLLNYKEVENNGTEFEMYLEKLVLYQPGVSFKSRRTPDRNESKLIARAILVIPVEGGHKGGRLNVYSNDSSQKSPSIIIERDNRDLHFSITSYFADCRHEMQPITEGSLITLEFKLISTKSFPWSLPVAFPLHSLFAGLAELKESLSYWADWKLRSQDKTTGNHFGNCFSLGNSDDICRPTVVIKNEDGNVIVEEDEEKDPATCPSVQFQPDEMLFIPLKNDYEEESLSFGKLSQPDLLLGELLQSIKFVDVHLAIVSQCITGPNHHNFEIEAESQQDPKERSFWIRKWIASTHSIPHATQFQLDIKTQLIGGIHKLLRRKLNYDRSKNEYFSVYYHAALVIQPRQQSVHLGCYYNFDAVLNHLFSTAASNECRSSSIETLGQVLTFCRLEPCRVWTNPCGLRLRRLMDLCTRLGANKESLELLAILGSDFDLDSRHGFIVPKKMKLFNEQVSEIKAPLVSTSSIHLNVPGSASGLRPNLRLSGIKSMARRETHYTPGVNRSINTPMQSSRLTVSTPSATPFGAGSQRGRRPLKPSPLARIGDRGCILSPIVTGHMLKAQSSPIKQIQSAENSSPHNSASSEEDTELFQMEETCNEQYWDNYMDGYVNETYYSEDPQDEDDARRLLEFGEDYRNHLDSFADYPSILYNHADYRQPLPVSKPFLSPQPAFGLTDLSPDSEANVDYLVHIVESSASQFAIALDTFNQMRSKKEPSQSYAKLLSTCRTNAHSLQAILFHVKQSDECSTNSAATVSLNELNPIQDLIVKWDQLDAEISVLHKQGLRHQLFQQILRVRKKFLELKAIILAINVVGDITANQNKVNWIKDQLESEKESLWAVNYEAHIQLAEQPGTAIVLLEDVASLYQMWDWLGTKVMAIDSLLDGAKKTLSNFQLGNLKENIPANHVQPKVKDMESRAARLEAMTSESFISSEWMENWNNMQLITIIFIFFLSFWVIKALFL